MRICWTILAVGVGLGVAPCNGALFKTPKQLIARYGKPFKVDRRLSIYLFRTATFTVNVQCIDGLSRSVTYLPRNYRSLRKDEIEALLRQNSCGSIWKVDRNVGWILENRKAIAQLGQPPGPSVYLKVMTSDYEKWGDSHPRPKQKVPESNRGK